MSAAEAKAAVVPESVLKKRKREEQWAADKKEKALADRKKALESRKIIFAHAKQYAQEYDTQKSRCFPGWTSGWEKLAWEKSSYLKWVSNKKVKSAHCSPIEKKDHDKIADSARSKFEWLNPSTIRDANRRRPNDPWKFYELYELDAEIGHKELDWKMTVSGVGKCRQVGISENGIDDAVDKLVAGGYKVGRVE